MNNLYNRPGQLNDEDTEKLLSELRKEVDNIDKEIAALLIKRISVTLSIAAAKIKSGLPSYSPERERKIMENILSYSKDELTSKTLRNIYERIIDETRAIQKMRSDDAK
jgi:chorismate mutase